MKYTRLAILVIVFTLFAMLAPAIIARDNAPATDEATTTTSSYPQRLIDEFPTIYADTAYTTDDCHLVVRAVWMSQRGRKVKVSSPEQLPVPDDCELVRFSSQCSEYQKNATLTAEAIVTQRK